MSLNCLTCGQVLQRVNSEREFEPEMVDMKVRFRVDRSWSGNINPPQRDLIKGGAVAKIKAEHRRSQSTGDGSPGPRLVRSSGMRRDWSFEDLCEKKDKRARFQ